MEAMEPYMRLALNAQGQCRATIDTLAAIKNTPVVFARQANLSNWPQQVNKGAPATASKDALRRAARSGQRPSPFRGGETARTITRTAAHGWVRLTDLRDA